MTQPGVSYIYSHCLVNLHYSHNLSRAECRQSRQSQPRGEDWLDYRPYRRQAELREWGRDAAFRTKPQRLSEMLQAQDWSRLSVKTLAFDHLSLTPEVVTTVTNLKLGWVSKADQDDHACWKEAWLYLGDILTRLPSAKFKAVWVHTSNGRQRYWVCKQRLRPLYQGQ